MEARRRRKQPPKVARGGEQRARQTALRALVFLPLLAVPFLLAIPTYRVGDGSEYLAQTFSIAQSASLEVREEHFRALEETAFRENLGEISRIGFLPRPGGGMEPLHFWLLPLLTAPFYYVARLLGAGGHHAYTLLFVALLVGVLELARRAHGLYGVLAVYLLAMGSPILWFLNKGHSEFFTFACLTAATLLLMQKQDLAGALALALASAQNVALAPLGALVLVTCLAVRVREKGLRLGLRREEWLLLGGSVFFLALPTVYYLTKYRVPNVIVDRGYSDLKAVTPGRVLSVFLDPDMGLYPNWPMGAFALLAAAAIIALGGRSSWREGGAWWRQRPAFGVFLAGFLTLMPFIHASQVNLNSGGTYHILRYATWYIGLHYIVFWYLARQAALAAQSPRWRFAAPGAALCAAAVLVQWNGKMFWPGKNENFLEPNWTRRGRLGSVANLYDQQPEVFLERGTRTESSVRGSIAEVDPANFGLGPVTAAAAGVWAVGSPDCRKLLVVPSMIESGRARTDLKPPGCEAAVDPERLLEFIKGRQLTKPGYVSLKSLDAFLPTLPVGQRILLFSPAAENFLGKGWYGPEGAWRWSEGSVSELAFRISEQEWRNSVTGQAYFQVEYLPYVEPGETNTIRLFLNGREVGVQKAARHFRPSSFSVPLAAGMDPVFRWRFEISNPSRPRPQEPRTLGIAAIAMSVTVR